MSNPENKDLNQMSLYRAFKNRTAGKSWEEVFPTSVFRSLGYGVLTWVGWVCFYRSSYDLPLEPVHLENRNKLDLAVSQNSLI